MEFLVTLEIALLLIGSLVVTILGLLIYQYLQSRTVERLKAPVYERIRTDAELEAKQILAEARDQAKVILDGAKTDREEITNLYQVQIEDAQNIVRNAQESAKEIIAKVEKDRDELTSLHQEQLHQAKAIIGNAQDQAKQIIATAREQREEIVTEYSDQINKLQASYQIQLESHTKTLITQIEKLQESQADRMTNASTELFESIIADHTKIRERFERVLSMVERTQKEIEDESSEAVASVKEKLKETAQILSDNLESYDTTVTETISNHISHTYEKIDEEMHVYREARKSILDRHLQQIIEDVANRVLRKQLTITEHAELAREALRDAKKDNVF